MKLIVRVKEKIDGKYAVEGLLEEPEGLDELLAVDARAKSELLVLNIKI